MYKLLSLFLFAYGLAVTTEDIYDNSWALIIGIDKYQNVPNLSYAVKDAESINEILVNTFAFPKENITILKNEHATKQNILKSFSDITKKAQDNDRVLIFFAGHGETMDLPEGGEKGYLIPVEGDSDDLYLTSIPMDELRQIALMSEAKHMLYLIDACYGGIAAVGSRGLEPETTPNWIEKITKDKSRQVITAGGRGEKVIEKPEWGHSAFTLNLNRGLKDGRADYNADGYITASELGLFLREKVTIDSENQQTPQYGRMTSHEGEFIFIGKVDNLIIDNTAVTVDGSNIDYEMLAKELTKQLQGSDQSSVNKENEKLQEVNLLYIGSPEKYLNRYKSLTELEKYFKKSKYAELLTLTKLELSALRGNIESDLLTEFYNQDVNYKVTKNDKEIAFINNAMNEMDDNHILAENIFEYFDKPDRIIFCYVFKLKTGKRAKQQYFADVISAKGYIEKSGYFNSAVNTSSYKTDSIEEIGSFVSEYEIGLVRSQIIYDVPATVEHVDENIVIINPGNLTLHKNMKLRGLTVWNHFDKDRDGYADRDVSLQRHIDDYKKALSYMKKNKIKYFFAIRSIQKDIDWLIAGKSDPEGQGIFDGRFSYILKVVDVRDSTVVTKLIELDYPWVEVRPGDIIILY